MMEEVFEPPVNAVREEMLALGEKPFTGSRRNDMVEEKRFQLEFLGKVPDLVHTGIELTGVEDQPLKVALLDSTGQIVTCEPESSAKVELVLLDASDSDDENNLTHEDFERKTVKVKDKGKPHFAKSVYIRLKNGVGDLSGVKLAHGKTYTKTCNRRLGVKIVQDYKGITADKAWTARICVKDKRDKLYKKHNKPSPSSEIWRLKEIARNGEPCKRLNKEHIETVEDLLFWQSVDPAGLRKISGAVEGKWRTTVTHANTFKFDDENMYSFKSSTELQLSVIYNRVGTLKGVTYKGRFVRFDNLSAKEKDHARELLREVLKGSAFGERYKTFFKNEASLVQEVPYRSSEITASTNSSMQKYLNDIDLTLSGTVTINQTTEPGSSSQSINSSHFCNSGPSYPLRSKYMGEHASSLFPDPINIDATDPLSRHNDPTDFLHPGGGFQIAGTSEVVGMGDVLEVPEKAYVKHYQPSLSFEDWTLKTNAIIYRLLIKHLSKESTKTELYSVFSLSLSSEGRQQKYGNCLRSVAIASHACTSTVDGEDVHWYNGVSLAQILFVYCTLEELNRVFAGSNLAPIDNLSKVHAPELAKEVLKSLAFGKLYGTVGIENSLLPEVPYRSSEINASTNSYMPHYVNDSVLTPSGNIGLCPTTAPGSSSQFVTHRNFYDSGPSNPLELEDIDELCCMPSDLQQKKGVTSGEVHAPELAKEVLKGSAFGEQYGTVFNIETLLLQEVPYGSSEINALTNSYMPQYVNDSVLTPSGNIGVCQTTAPGSSSQFVIHRNFSDSELCDMPPDLQQKKGVASGEQAGAQELLPSACNNWFNVEPLNDLQSSTFLPPTRTDPLDTLHPGGVTSEQLGESSSKYSDTWFSLDSSEDYILEMNASIYSPFISF